MDKWQECTTRAMTEYRLKYFGNAILLHQQALETARFRVEDEARLSSERALSKVVISYFNLADCYIALGEIERASDFYLAAQRFLQDAGHTLHERPDFMAALCHALDHLNMTWADFLRQHRDAIPMRKLSDFHQGLQFLMGNPSGVCH